MTRYPQVEAEFFAQTQAVRFLPDLQGQAVGGLCPLHSDVPEGVVLLGDAAGPSRELSNLCHEMAHFVEIDDARMQIPGWGLIYPEVWVINRMCIEPTTLQITEREMRVAAYQLNLLEHLGAGVPTWNVIESYRFLPDFIYVPKDENGNWDKSRLKWIEAETNKLKPVYTFERFRSEWDRKVALLEAQ